MANSTVSQYLYFDSVTGASVTGKVRILGILWMSNEGAGLDIAADDDLLITDSKGNIIVSKRAESAEDCLQLIIPYPGLYADGLIVTTMDGGTVTVWIA